MSYLHHGTGTQRNKRTRSAFAYSGTRDSYLARVRVRVTFEEHEVLVELGLGLGLELRFEEHEVLVQLGVQRGKVVPRVEVVVLRTGKINE